MGALRQAIETYKKIKHEQKEKSRLLRKDLDYAYLEKMLNSLSDNPNKLMITIKFANGVKIDIKRQEAADAPMRDPYVEVVE